MFTIYILAAGTLAGAIILQAAVVAPSVFAELDEPQARRLLRRLFPRFFQLGVICGAIMLLSAGFLLISGIDTALTRTLASMAAAMTIIEGVSLWLVPRINAARDAGEAGAVDFAHLHRLSVVLTVVVLLLAGLALASIGATINLPKGS